MDQINRSEGNLVLNGMLKFFQLLVARTPIGSCQNSIHEYLC